MKMEHMSLLEDGHRCRASPPPSSRNVAEPSQETRRRDGWCSSARLQEIEKAALIVKFCCAAIDLKRLRTSQCPEQNELLGDLRILTSLKLLAQAARQELIPRFIHLS
eukprot:Skav216532  [mRNA]  locus=scaffold1592:28485:28808:+ [translate_table: standard]